MQQVVGLGGTSAAAAAAAWGSFVSRLWPVVSDFDCSEPCVHLTSGWDWTSYALPTLPMTARMPRLLPLLPPTR